MVAVWRSEGVFLILPMVAAAVGMRERAVKDVCEATAAFVCRCSTGVVYHVCCPFVGSGECGGAELVAACPPKVFRSRRAGEIGAEVKEDRLKHSGAGAASRALPVR